MAPKWTPFCEWDLNSSGLLPKNWRHAIGQAIDKFGFWTNLSGDSVVSREKQKGVSIPVLVVTGDTIDEKLSWLRSLYSGPLRRFSSKWYGKQLYIAKDLRSSVNINCLRGIGARYESHVDSNTVTGVLFVSDVTRRTGGELVFQGPRGNYRKVYPKPGLFIAFDARKIPHWVTPLRKNFDRISAPMNYYDHPLRQIRPPGLDDYLYSKSERKR